MRTDIATPADIRKNGSPFGFCPYCNSPGYSRERRPGGDDRCTQNHHYPSSCALDKPKEKIVAKVR